MFNSGLDVVQHTVGDCTNISSFLRSLTDVLRNAGHRKSMSCQIFFENVHASLEQDKILNKNLSHGRLESCHASGNEGPRMTTEGQESEGKLKH